MTTEAAGRDRLPLLIHQLFGEACSRTPSTCCPRTQENFERLLKEILDGCAGHDLRGTHLIHGPSDEDVRNLFREARSRDYG
jgi:hypothetical protein